MNVSLYVRSRLRDSDKDCAISVHTYSNNRKYWYSALHDMIKYLIEGRYFLDQETKVDKEFFRKVSDQQTQTNHCQMTCQKSALRPWIYSITTSIADIKGVSWHAKFDGGRGENRKAQAIVK